MKKGLTNSLGWLILETQKSRACVELRQISTVLTSLIITMLLCFPMWCHKPYSSLLPNKPQRFFRDCQWWNSLKGVCTFLSFLLRFHSFRLRENASGWSAPKVDSPVLNWRTDPWHQPWCTLHVWISCPSNSTNEFGRNLGDAQIGIRLETWKGPPFHSCVYFKKSAFPLELPRGRSPFCPWPRSGLFQFALRLEDRSENVQDDKRVGMARSQLRFMTSERFALQFFSLAARGGAAAALQTSNVSVRQFV